jgi:putative glutamine amidotransferase
MLETPEAADAFVALLDGLVITGGPAITDGLVGSLPDEIEETADARLASDKHVLGAFLAARRPVLGICYGMQLGNAAAGGTLYADVEAQHPESAAHSQKRGASEHAVTIESDTHLHRVLQQTTVPVNTRHLQAIQSPGSGHRVAARAPDGVIEAVESEDGLFLGVQWHPERMPDTMDPLFAHLVEHARRSMAAA